MVPVSSSAQLVLLPWLLDWEQPADRTTFAAGLHAGSCLGIAWALRAELRALGARELALLAAASVPAAVAGLLAADVVEERLGRPPQLAALLAGAGALMWWVDARAADDGTTVTASRMITSDTPGASDVIMGVGGSTPYGGRGSAASRMITSNTRGASDVIMRLGGGAPGGGAPGGGAPGVPGRAAALAALAQVAALVPGVSRSGATLTALRAAGVERAAAERFALLMSLPVTAGAAGLTLARADRRGLCALAPGLASGAATAALAGAAAAHRRAARPGRPLRGAALYRLGLAGVVGVRLRARRRRT